MLHTAFKNIDPLQLVESINELKKIITLRIKTYFDSRQLSFITPNDNNFIAEDIARHFTQQLTSHEWIILLLVMAPHTIPNFFESIIQEHMPAGGDFPEFGGVRGTNHRSMLPTGETAQFVLAGNDIEERLKVHEFFSNEHFFYKQNILWLEPVKEGEPVMSGRIIMAQEWVDKILLDKETAPRFGLDFPAKKITTEMKPEDVVLNEQTAQQVNDIEVWLTHHQQLFKDENLKRKVKPGYRVLFHGPSGTGKTLTAALLGKKFDKDVYRIDLSQVVSKYIGETEKNLESVFRRAESKNWILFFDEADALFGKRTNVQSSHDKYANQEVSYLLQRIEDYPGLLILASNFKSNLDEAFIRRFHSIIHFPLPNTEERFTLWQKSMPAGLPHDVSIDLSALAKKYEMSGASILNAVQTATLQAYAKGSKIIRQADLIDGVRKEYQKEEKSI